MKRGMYYFIILICLCFYCGNTLFAQDTIVHHEDLFKKNKLHISYGQYFFYSQILLHYERMLNHRIGKTSISPFVTLGFVTVEDYSSDPYDFYFSAHYGWLTGYKTHHLEISTGVAYFIKARRVSLSGSLGWRIQKPGSNFMFRAGIGFPESLYAGIGFAF